MRHPGVPFPPPLLFAAGLAVGLWLHGRMPLPISGPPALQIPVAGTLLLAGAGVLGWAMLGFKRARTAIYPNQPASRLVAAGPYRFSRNPMYLGLCGMYLGIALWARSAWPVLLLPVVLWLLWLLVIRREERYLKGAFGAEYEAYRRRVRRWL